MKTFAKALNLIKKTLRGSLLEKPKRLVVLMLLLFSAAVYLTARFSVGFAEFWARYPSASLRYILAKVTSLFPFSLAEVLIIASAAGVVIICLALLFAIFRKKPRSPLLKKSAKCAACIALAVAFTFLLGFGPLYFRKTLPENLSLEKEPLSGEMLYETAVWLAGEIDKLIPFISFAASGESHMPYSFDRLETLVNRAFADFAKDKAFLGMFTSRVKPVALSNLMTYTHISGVYTFFTGEANVNVNYPDFIIPFTIAHEMAHQRGIAREDEANFVAFLVCVNSGDPYIRYSGYINVLNEVTPALYSADKQLYKDFRNNYYGEKIADEMSAYSVFFEKYRKSPAAKVVTKTNNAFLSSQKVDSGVKSYGLVADLAAAYYKAVIGNNAN